MMPSINLVLATVATLVFGQAVAQNGVCSAVTNTCFINGNAFPCTQGGCSEEGNCYRENVVGVFPPQWNTYCE
ncbi:hypothetical protein V8F20_003311 [Naviculisporaceae sp. PSN 640]